MEKFITAFKQTFITSSIRVSQAGKIKSFDNFINYYQAINMKKLD